MVLYIVCYEHFGDSMSPEDFERCLGAAETVRRLQETMWLVRSGYPSASDLLGVIKGTMEAFGDTVPDSRYITIAKVEGLPVSLRTYLKEHDLAWFLGGQS